jgi:DNA-binding NarL/FixJ family response regulator
MRILLADDHALIRAGLRSELSDLHAGVQFVEAWDVASLEDALASTDELDLALVDLSMPGMQGAETIAALRERHPSVPLVIVSGVDAASVAHGVLQAGAAGFIPKSAMSTVVVHAIRLVLAGGKYVPAELLHALEPRRPVQAPDAGTGVPVSPSQGSPHIDRLTILSPRQREVFELLATGLSNKHIARALNITEGTVKTHVATIFDVLRVHNRVSAVAEARRLLERGTREGTA